MKLKYYIIPTILLFLPLENLAQNNLPNVSGFFISEAGFGHLPGNFNRISVPQPIFSQLKNKVTIGFQVYNGESDVIYFGGKMPTLNQFKNSIFEKIEVSAKSETRMNFNYSEDSEENGKTESGSFFSSNLFYFLGAAALATTFYFIWQDNRDESLTKSFGYPPRPQTNQ